MFERVAQIRDEAFGRRVRERLLPSQEVLAQRLFRQSQELADVQRHLQRYHALVIALREQLRHLNAEAGGDDPRLLALQRQLNDGLARALATEPVDMLDVMDDMLKVVSAQVTLRPSGHQFAVEGRETLLQAGMRAGLKLNYGCGNGTCGMCKVRVTAGDVVRTMATDYPLSENEKSQGYVLACAHTAASSELTLETLEASRPGRHPAAADRDHRARAARRWRPTRCCCTCRRRAATACASWPGSGSRSGWPRARTCTPSIRSPAAPATTATCSSSFRAAPSDPLAARLFGGAVKPGDAVTVWGPGGDFVLVEDPHPLVFAACDTGFAPVKSLIEHALVARRRAVDQRCSGWPRGPTGTSWPTSAAPGRKRSTRSNTRCRRTPMRPPAPARWPRRSAPTCSTSTAPSTSPAPRPSCDTLRAELGAAGVPASQIHAGGDRMSCSCQGARRPAARPHGRPTTAPAAAPSPSRCACSATTWRPNSTTARSSSSSPTAR